MATDGSPHVGVSNLANLVADEAVHVLHVDDEASLLELAGTFLSRYGLQVTTAENAEAARQHLSNRDIDCVVSDYDMPDENGVEFLRSVRKQYPKLPFILFTGKGSEEIASEAISAGVTDYLQKENGTEQWRVLANRVENVVERRRSERLVEYSYKAMETAREGISLLDEEGHFVYVNRSYADIVGYDREGLVGKHWETLYPEAELKKAHDEILPTVRREGTWEGENTYLRKDGSAVRVDHALSAADGGVLVCLIQPLEE